jgi:hypothetical protein
LVAQLLVQSLHSLTSIPLIRQQNGWPWRLADKVNNSGYVAPRPLPALGSAAATGHSVPDHALDGRE